MYVKFTIKIRKIRNCDPVTIIAAGVDDLSVTSSAHGPKLG